jgi:predicted MPP superfamily phosphohydrolase
MAVDCMKRLVWITDIHLNFASNHHLGSFCRAILDAAPDAVLLGGDIGEAPSVADYLHYLERSLQRPIYFVLGNHDFYQGQISQVQASIVKLCGSSSLLRWLSAEDAIELTPETGLVGHDSWADGRFGKGAQSNVLLNDYLLIREFVGLSHPDRFKKLREMGDASADHFARVLPKALKRFPSVILLTHVPPFRESCWHEGQISDDEALPHFSCKAVGEVLQREMMARPDNNLTVLCGHTHGGGKVDILPNLHVITGASEYGSPRIQEVISIR